MRQSILSDYIINLMILIKLKKQNELNITKVNYLSDDKGEGINESECVNDCGNGPIRWSGYSG